MADVKWIKIVTDVFDDDKIKLIESMPEADSIIVIWFKLLCLAGKQNRDGFLMLNDKIAYTDEMLSTIFRRSINIVRLALKTFEQFEMIEIAEGTICITNWDKHQNTDRLAELREYNRIAKRKSRANKKLLALNDDVNDKSMTSQRCQDTDIDIDKELDKDKKKDKKHKYGEYNNVLLSDKELQSLKKEYNNTDELIKYLDEYIEMKGYKAKSHYLCIKKWVVDAVNKNGNKTVQAPQEIDKQAEELLKKFGGS